MTVEAPAEAPGDVNAPNIDAVNIDIDLDTSNLSASSRSKMSSNNSTRQQRRRSSRFYVALKGAFGGSNNNNNNDLATINDEQALDVSNLSQSASKKQKRKGRRVLFQEEVEVKVVERKRASVLQNLFYSKSDISQFKDEKFEEEAAELERQKQAEKEAKKAEKEKKKAERKAKLAARRAKRNANTNTNDDPKEDTTKTTTNKPASLAEKLEADSDPLQQRHSVSSMGSASLDVSEEIESKFNNKSPSLFDQVDDSLIRFHQRRGSLNSHDENADTNEQGETEAEGETRNAYSLLGSRNELTRGSESLLPEIKEDTQFQEERGETGQEEPKKSINLSNEPHQDAPIISTTDNGTKSEAMNKEEGFDDKEMEADAQAENISRNDLSENTQAVVESRSETNNNMETDAPILSAPTATATNYADKMETIRDLSIQMAGLDATQMRTDAPLQPTDSRDERTNEPTEETSEPPTDLPTSQSTPAIPTEIAEQDYILDELPPNQLPAQTPTLPSLLQPLPDDDQLPTEDELTAGSSKQDNLQANSSHSHHSSDRSQGPIPKHRKHAPSRIKRPDNYSPSSASPPSHRKNEKSKANPPKRKSSLTRAARKFGKMTGMIKRNSDSNAEEPNTTAANNSNTPNRDESSNLSVNSLTDYGSERAYDWEHHNHQQQRSKSTDVLPAVPEASNNSNGESKEEEKDTQQLPEDGDHVEAKEKFLSELDRPRRTSSMVGLMKIFMRDVKADKKKEKKKGKKRKKERARATARTSLNPRTKRVESSRAEEYRPRL